MSHTAAPWWRDAVFYQIYPRSFMDENGDGIGDLGGIMSRLDYLSDTLGVDALWISPFYPSPMADFGYDVTDYCDVDPIFGTLADFDRLLTAAHERGLKVVIDWVPNHTSDRHPWFVESRSSRDNPKRNWYVWRDAKPDGSPPNNWASVFGGAAWEWDEPTGQYYLHSFVKEQADLDWRNPEVKAAMLDVLRFWLDRGVDGFRMDVVHFIMKDPDMRDNPLLPGPAGRVAWAFAAQQHVHDRAHDDVHPVFREIRAVLEEYDGNRVAIGEVEPYPWDRWVRFYGDDDELHLPFNFELLYGEWTTDAIRASVGGMEAALPDFAWPTYVLGNHDQPRLGTRVGRAQARVAAILLLTLRGTPTMYYGDELGMQQVYIPDDRQLDPWGRNVPGNGRDGCRTPMQWEDSSHAGFSTAAPWLPLNDDWRTHTVAAEVDDPDSMLELYRRLLAFRRASPALRHGSYADLPGVPDGVLAYRREHGGERVLVVLNLTGDPKPVQVDAGTAAVATHRDREGDAVAGTLELRGDEGIVVSLDEPGQQLW